MNIKEYYRLANQSFERFTPDFLEKTDLRSYLEANRESLVSFLQAYQDQFGSFAKHEEILELGCGLGGLSMYLNRAGYPTLGVDQSLLAIQSARFLNQKERLACSFKVLDVCLNKTLGAQFQYIIDSHLLHCLVRAAHRKAYFRFVKEHLRPGGFFFIETMTYHSHLQIPVGYQFGQEGELAKEMDSVWVPYRSLKDSIELEAECKEAGFSICYLYFHNELSFDVFPEYESMKTEFLPKTLRLVLTH